MSNEYILITDDSCDLPISYLKKADIPFVELSYIIDGQEFKGSDKTGTEFFAEMKKGKMPITAQVNQQTFVDIFTPYLEQGKDILYLAFSSGLSGTCNSGQQAAAELSEKYPDRKIYVVDTLCASLGQGLLVHKVNEKRKEGLSVDELRDYAEDLKLKIIHTVTVDDLMHLHRGGRISKTSAVAGSLLGIKPIIQLKEEGKLIPVAKVRGRQQALIRIVDDMEKLVGDTPNDIFMICHGDCLEDAEKVAEMVKKRFGVKECLINYVGSVIGAHTGPGVVALFMVGNGRS